MRKDIGVFIPHFLESMFNKIINQNENNTVIGLAYRPNAEHRADIDVFSSILFDIMEINNTMCYHGRYGHQLSKI